ncbi:hypothetical protein CK489_16370 [Bradyrhizobium sp. UFLA03-84]|uniref:hypothetical protein n=1 Tax=Bradyrhizobium sp. UFLA03-84 TaxID=418599 RepID=UPI000BADF750|nr:hypothetical protein [Bradyrhizobium sp. UFLA03-84]PAY07355.1 hypothetical protein CK489_16370 [Bradyrhizobium sp. UFLA03-84]
MTREEALENAIASLKEWSEGKAETSVVLARLRILWRLGSHQSRLQGRRSLHKEYAAMDRLNFIPAFEAAIRSADPEKLAALRETIRQRGGMTSSR